MKTYRIIIAIMMLCIFVSATAMLSSCDMFATTHEHELSLVAEVKATCTAEGTEAYYDCSDCDKLFADAEGKTEIAAPAVIEKAAHSFTNYVSNSDATCTADGTKTAKCDNCSETDTVVDEGSKAAHSFTNYVSNGDATCTADGTKTAKCDNCFKTDTVADKGSKVSHSFTNYVSNGDATCVQDGTKTAQCDNCSATDTVVDEGNKGSHSFTNYVSNNDGTCVKDNTKTATCDNCSATDTIVDEGNKGDHSFTNYVSNNDGTCVKDNTKTAQCNYCSETDTIVEEGNKGDHSYTNYVSDANATCTEDGTKTAQCNYCSEKDTIVDEDSAKGHSPADAVKENLVPASCKDSGSYDSVVYCSVESCQFEISREKITVDATGEHVYATEKEKVEATCTADGYVVMACGCGEEQRTTLTAPGHTEVVDAALAPTCTETGLTAGKHCDVCKVVLEAQESIDALGHTEVVDAAVDATCTETGLTEGKHCSVCEETIVAQDVVPALGHSETLAHVETIDATFESEGSMGYYTCPVCNKNFVDEACTIEINEFALPKLSLADYTTTTTVNESVVTTVFTLISDTIEYSVSLESDSCLTVDVGEGAICVSKYDYQKLNSDNVIVTYEEGKGYLYTIVEGATESLVSISTSGAAFNLVVSKGSTLTCSSLSYASGNSVIVDGTLNVDGGITISGAVVEDESYEYGFIPGLYVRHGTANITGSITTNSLQVGSEAEDASGTLNATHSDNSIVIASAKAKTIYVFAAGALNINNTGSGKTALYINTTGGAIVDIRSGMTMTFEGGISNMIGTWKYGSSNYHYYVSVEEGAKINGSGNFFRAGRDGELDANIYCWNTVEINVGGEIKKVKVVNTTTYDAGKVSHALSKISFHTSVENAVYTNTGNTVSCAHLGDFKEATYTDGDTTYTIYYQE